LYAPPEDVRGLDTEVLLSEPPVAVLPVSHPLAQRVSLPMADLAGENLHEHPTDANAMGSPSELMHLTALRRTVAALPQSLTTPLRDDVTTVAVTGVPPSALLLAWPAHSTHLRPSLSSPGPPRGSRLRPERVVDQMARAARREPGGRSRLRSR
jgi:DNA-binding transcriptional LysR family regulator